jgi:hypothetical protein
MKNLYHKALNPKRYAAELDKWEEIGACIMLALMLISLFAF